MSGVVSIIDAIRDRPLFGAAFKDASTWAAAGLPSKAT
jgi:hypothetical protein